MWPTMEHWDRRKTAAAYFMMLSAHGLNINQGKPAFMSSFVTSKRDIKTSKKEARTNLKDSRTIHVSYRIESHCRTEK